MFLWGLLEGEWFLIKGDASTVANLFKGETNGEVYQPPLADVSLVLSCFSQVILKHVWRISMRIMSIILE